MMTKKKLREIEAEVAALLDRLPGHSARAWLDREIAAARRSPSRDVETLEMLCAVLERALRLERNETSCGIGLVTLLDRRLQRTQFGGVHGARPSIWLAQNSGDWPRKTTMRSLITPRLTSSN